MEDASNVIFFAQCANEKALRAAKRSIEDGVDDGGDSMAFLFSRVEAIMNAADPLYETREENRRLVEENARLKLQVAALVELKEQHHRAYEDATKRANALNSRLQRIQSRMAT